jgi:hypothetical protein
LLKLSVLFASILFVAGFNCLALAPQNPDGAELVMAAMHGAVLHPPGYPLQAWIGKIWSLTPVGNSSWGFSLLSIMLQSLAAFVFMMASREYGLRPLAGLVATGILFCFPPVFMLGVQPEKYALILLFASLLLMERFWFLSGFALTQHFGLIIFIPLVMWRYSKTEYTHKWLRFIILLVASFSFAQMSLLFLAKFGGWPDWGALRTWHDVVRHTMRSDLGFLGGIKEMGPYREQLSSLGVLIDLWGGLLLIWGTALIPVCNKLKNDRMIQILLVSAALGIGALWLARLPGTSQLELEYLSRYWVIALPLIALLIGIGVEYGPRWQKLFGIMALAATLISAGIHRQDLSLAKSRVFDVYREALSSVLGHNLGQQLPNAPVYISSSDVEPFWGVKSGDGRWMFPIAGDYPWFLERKVFEFDPRVGFWFGGQPPPNTAAIMQRAFELGIPVVTTTPDALPLASSWKSYGLYSESSIAGVSASSVELEDVARNICAAVVYYRQDTPGQIRYGSLELWEKLREPFRLLRNELVREKKHAEAGQVEAIYTAMELGKNRSALSMCEAFLRAR